MFDHEWTRRLFNYFLVPPLDTAFSFTKMNYMPKTVSEDLSHVFRQLAIETSLDELPVSRHVSQTDSIAQEITLRS